MWRFIRIQNFRSIAEAELYLPPFSTVVGPNGSGKSNFADALVFARDIGVDAEGAIERRGGIGAVRRWSHSRPYDVTVDVWTAASRRQLEGETDFFRHSFVIKSAAGGAWKFGEETIEFVRGGTPKYEFKRSGNKVTKSKPDVFGKRLKLTDTTSLMLYAKQFSPRLRTGRIRHIRLAPQLMREPQVGRLEAVDIENDGKNIAVALRALKAPQLESVLAPMRKIVPGLLRIDVETLGRHLVLVFTQKQRGSRSAKFYAGDMSEGALRALGIVVAAEQMRRNELLVLEEPEVNLHVGASRVLFDVLREAANKGAVLMTTHSAELLDAAKDEEIFVCEYRNGATSIGRLAESQRKVVRDGLFSVAELMRSEPLRMETADHS